MGKVTDWITKEYGCRTATQTKVVVLSAAAATRVLQNDPNRFAWEIFNLALDTAFIGFTGDTTTTNGIGINPSGGNIGLTVREDLELPTHEMYGIGTAATTLFVVETVAI
jgi:hypothetical protein